MCWEEGSCGEVKEMIVEMMSVERVQKENMKEECPARTGCELVYEWRWCGRGKERKGGRE